MHDGNIFDLILALFGSYLMITFRQSGRIAVKQGKQINDWMPKWVPWPFRLSDKAFNNKDIKWSQFLSLIGGIWFFIIGISQFLT